MDKKPTILIVDDDPGLKRTLSDILRAKGYATLAAAKGKTALNRVNRKRPAVALIDLKLPDMDGLEVMREIRKRSPDTECIVLTGYGSQASAIEAVNLGAYGYIQKPYDVEQLVLTIRRAIEKRQAEDTLRSSREFIRTVFNSVSDAISAIDTTNFTTVGANRAFLNTLSMEEKDVIGKHCYELTHHRSKPCELPDEPCPLAETLKTGRHSSAEHIHYDRDGRERYVEVSTSPIRNEKGEIHQVVHVSRDITERRRAEKQLRRSLEETARGQRLLLALSQAAQAVQRTRTPDEVYRTTGDEITRLGYHAVVFTLTEDRTHLAVSHLTFESAALRAAEKLAGLSAQNYRFPLVPGGFFHRTLSEGETTFTEPTADHMAEALPEPVRPLAGRLAALLGLKQSIIAPLTVSGETHGLLGVTGAGLTEADVPAVTVFANQAAIALENARLYEETRRKAEELAVLNEIGRAVSSVMELDDLLESIGREASRVIDTSNLYIALCDAKKKEMAFPLYLEEGKRRRPEKRPARGGMTEYVINSAKPLMINHDLVSRLKELDVELIGRPSKSWLGVPMLSEDRAIGVLAIQDYHHENAYNESHLRLLSTIANQAAIAIENARLYEETQRHLEQVTALREIDRAISSTLELPEVLDIILEQLERVIPYTSAAIFLITDDTAKVTAARGFPDLEKAMQVSFSVKDDALARQLLEERRPLVLVDAQDDKRFQGRGGTEYVRSWIRVPLIVKGEAIGFLTIDHREPGVYDEGSAETALAFASQVAIAIENARLYEGLRRELAERKRAEEALKGATLETVAAVSSIVEANDPYTAGHSARVTEIAIEIAQQMGLQDGQIDTLRIAGPLHDLGKVGISSSVLNKPATLTQAEWLMIQSHPVVSAQMAERVAAFKDAVPIIRHHHERWDGTGYPDGLKGEDIPLLARILAVADGYEAMTSERPYRRALTEEEALAELEKGASAQWDPAVVKVFLKLRKPPAKRKGRGKRKRPK